MKRIFIALDISEDAKNAVKSYSEALKKGFENLKIGWEKNEKLHLTLKFLGDVEEKKLQDVLENTKICSKNFPKFSLEIKGNGVFPNIRKPRILWLGITDKSNVLFDLQNEIENFCVKLGFPKENRIFKPHLTIARLKEPEKSVKLAQKHQKSEFLPLQFKVEKITVYQSHLLPQGSRYEAVSNFEFSNFAK